MNARVTELEADGSRFEGRLSSAGAREGRGTLHLPGGGGSVRGSWRAGELVGEVVLTDEDGGTTVAEWGGSGGLEGPAVERHADGELRWTGSYRDGERHGDGGAEFNPDGSKYEGRWELGEFTGDANSYVCVLHPAGSSGGQTRVSGTVARPPHQPQL